MDEPCSALDPTSTRRIEETIGEIRDEVTIVIVTHNMQQAARVSQQCAFFLAEQGTPGGIVEAGRPADLRPAGRPANRGLCQRPFRLTSQNTRSPMSPPSIDPGSDRLVDRGLPWSCPLHRRCSVLVIIGSIGVFLGFRPSPPSVATVSASSPGPSGNPSWTRFGIAATLIGTFEVAIVALVIAFPLAIVTALFISEYAPAPASKSLLVGMVDLMAAVPSIIYGTWGLLLMPHAKFVSRWIAQYFGWIPIFRVNTDPNAAVWAQSRFVASAFIAGVCVP